MLTNEQIQLIQEVNRRILIIGKFTCDGNGRMFHFKRDNIHNLSKTEGNLSREDFFKLVQPEIVYRHGGKLDTGVANLNTYYLGTPFLNNDADIKIKIPSDSILLETNETLGTEMVQIQKKGLKLFEELVKDLHFLANFYHPNFSRALLHYAKEYIIRHANNNEKQQISITEGKLIDAPSWKNVMLNDPHLDQIVVQYLCCYMNDEKEILSAFERKLRELSNDEKLILKEKNPDQVSILMEALIKCKNSLLIANKEAKDKLYADIEQANTFSWLENYTSNPKFGFPISNIDNKERMVKDQYFYSCYQAFMKVSDNVNRIIRSEPQHAYMFCGLASKYARHETDMELNDVGKAMYSLSVSQHDDRKITPDKEEENKYLSIVSKAKLDDSFAPDITKEKGSIIDLYDSMDKDKKSIADKLKKTAEMTMLKKLEAERSFSKKSLKKSLEILFAYLGQMSGGSAAKMLAINNEIASKLSQKFYQKFLAVSNISLNDFEKNLLKIAENDTKLGLNESLFIQKIFEDIQCQDKDKVIDENTKKQLLEKYLDKYGSYVKTDIVKRILKESDTFDQEVNDLTQAYRNYINNDVQSKNKTAGITMSPATNWIFPDDEYISSQAENSNISETYLNQTYINSDLANTRKVNWENSRGQAISGSAEEEESVALLTNELKDELKEKIAFEEVNEDNKVEVPVKEKDTGNELGKYVIDNKYVRKIGDFTLENKENVSFLINDNVVEIDPRVFENLQCESSEIENRSTPIDYNEFSKIAKYQNEIHSGYFKKGDDTDDLQRGLRALTFGERILSSPDGTTSIDKPDTSINLGIIFKAIDCVGTLIASDMGDMYNHEISAWKRKDGGEIEINGSISKYLNQIDFSQYIPLPEDQNKASDALYRFLDYQYELSKTLSRIESYLTELNELGNFFDAIKNTNIEIMLIDGSLKDHINDIEENGDGDSDFFACKKPPLFVYFSKQTNIDEDLEGYKLMLDGIEDDGVAIDSDRDAPPSYPFLQLPIFIVNQEQKKEYHGCSVIDINNVPLPSLINAATTPNTNENIVVQKVIQKNPYLLQCASIMKQDILKNSFSDIEKIEKYRRQRSKWFKKSKRNPKPNTPLVDLLEDFWVSNKDTYLIDTLVLNKIINLLRLIRLSKVENVELPYQDLFRLADNDLVLQMVDGLSDRLHNVLEKSIFYVQTDNGMSEFSNVSKVNSPIPKKGMQWNKRNFINQDLLKWKNLINYFSIEYN